ncbi:MAG: transcription termination factor NusA [Clostridiales bacterium]
MNVEFLEALKDLEKERNISADIILDAIDAALVSAYKKNFGSSQNVRTEINRETGDFHVFSRKNIVEDVEDERLEISLAEAEKINPGYEPGDIYESEVTPRDFGRIAAQTAKQVVVQRMREAERNVIFDEYMNMEGDILMGIIQRVENKNVFLDIGKTEAILTPNEQIPGETYRHGDRLRVYMVEIKKSNKGPQVVVSRTHPGLLKRLFEQEVPEIYDGIVEIKSIAREAGSRSKIAVYSKDENVDSLGACVGAKGMRVQSIVDELRGEKIDIVKWSPEPDIFISNALSPAKVEAVEVLPEEKFARVIVPNYQLSLAIGKEGQNARLAVKLTGWKIDIKASSDMEYLEEVEDEVFIDDETAQDMIVENVAEGNFIEEETSIENVEELATETLESGFEQNIETATEETEETEETLETLETEEAVEQCGTETEETVAQCNTEDAAIAAEVISEEV